MSKKSMPKKIGIGFATGRKSFQNVLRAYIYNWNESGLVNNENISLNVLIAYDLKYNKTKVRDYTNVRPDLLEQLDSCEFVGQTDIKKEIDNLVYNNVISIKEAGNIFGKGYAGNRNALLYQAVKNKLDCLLFLDDDEYPVAVTNTRNDAVWGGQHVLATHLKNINEADITHGRHCGYISPIPYLVFDESMTENDFKMFIEAISNDILNWDKIRNVMEDGGVTYADTHILIDQPIEEVCEIEHAKFISGANLCINLNDPSRVFPFYNPPGARGEDTFLSTCLTERKVLRVPCYTFHDGFSTYNHLLGGVLPTKLKFIRTDSTEIVNRFYRACIGWIRYKPLLVYITNPDRYENIIADMKAQLEYVLPKICNYFDRQEFMDILVELDKYHRNVKKHYREFTDAVAIWTKIMNYLKNKNSIL